LARRGTFDIDRTKPDRFADEAFLIEHVYVVRNADGTPYRIPFGWFPGSLLIDFTNPDAAA